MLLARLFSKPMLLARLFSKPMLLARIFTLLDAVRPGYIIITYNLFLIILNSKVHVQDLNQRPLNTELAPIPTELSQLDEIPMKHFIHVVQL